jgi:hypothetical protein
MGRMSNAIVTSLPGLKVLEWSQNQWDKQWHTVSSFGSFSGLKQLTSLTVDYQLLVPTGNGSSWTPLHLLRPNEYLPGGLQSLHLTDVMDGDVTKISTRFLKGTPPATTVNFITNLVAALPCLATIQLSLPMGSWHDDDGNRDFKLPRRMRKLLPHLVEALDGMGVVLEVWRQTQVGGQAKIYFCIGLDTKRLGRSYRISIRISGQRARCIYGRLRLGWWRHLQRRNCGVGNLKIWGRMMRMSEGRWGSRLMVKLWSCS